MSLSNLSLTLSLLLLSQIIAITFASDYSPKLEPNKSEPEISNYGPKQEPKKDYYYGGGLKSEKEEKITPYKIGVQGIIYCKLGQKLIPLKGALARVTCLIVDKDGYESSPFSVLSEPTDAKGYFLANVSPYGLQSYQNDGDFISQCNCKAFLEKSPWESCSIATDVNKGITGAPLSKSYRVIENNVKLYSVDPFFYTPASNTISNKY